MESKWINCVDSKSTTQNKYVNWLTKPHIISKEMKKLCDNLSVKVIAQKIDYILPTEAKVLNIDHQDTYVRKVYLAGDNTPWEYARVIVPTNTYKKYQDAFETLGGKLIGENLLYNNPKTTRSSFEYTELNSKHYIFKQIQQHLTNIMDIIDSITIWGRRSIFHVDGEFPLLVSEFFLPAIPNYPHNC